MTVVKLLLTLLTSTLFGAAFAQDALQGDWQGQIGPGSLNLSVVVHFSEDDGVLAGSIDIPAQGAEGVPLELLEATDEGATFVIQGVPGNATFEGRLENDTLAGTFSQGGQDFPFELSRQPEGGASGPASVPALLGDWQGTIDPGGVDQRVGLSFTDADGILQGSISFPDQGATLPLRIETASETELRFVIEGAPGDQRFTGRLEGNQLTGEFSVSGQSFAATLERGEAASIRRPQEPQPPFPYATEEVTVPSGGVELAGTLSLPEGKGPFPAVFFITGSGPQDRDETLYGHKPFLLLADTLTRAGFATLRLDDRGVGGSGGDFEEAGYEDFAADATAGLEYLRAHPQVDPARVGFLAHSEGGFVAPLAIARGAEAAFFIAIAGPAVPGIEVLELQNRLIYQSLGADGEMIDAQLAYLEELHAAIAENRLEDARQLTREQLEAFTGEQPLSDEQREQVIEAQVASLDAAWYRDLITFDPQPYLRQVQVPTLAIYGKLDLQVPAVQSSGVMEGLLRRAGNEDVTVVSLGDANHLMQPSIAGEFPEYGRIETTMKPEVLELITDWLTERFGE